MQYVSSPHHYIGNRRQENNGLGRIGVSGHISRLQSEHSDRFTEAQLRTMQRRVKEWRGIMAKQLVYATTDETFAELDGLPELALIGADSKC